MICSYIDDMLIFCIDLDDAEKTKRFLFNNFDMKDMGAVDVTLGMKIIRDGKNLGLSQSHII